MQAKEYEQLQAQIDEIEAKLADWPPDRRMQPALGQDPERWTDRYGDAENEDPGSALVHLPHGGQDGPNPKPLCDVPVAADRVRASGRQHPVQHRHADGCLGLLSREAACAQSRSDQRLVAAHRRFDQRALTVAG